MPSRYDVGDIARLTTTTRDLAGVLTDPTTIFLRVAQPDGAVVQYDPVHDGTGQWHYDLPLTAPDRWAYWWDADGSVTVAGGDILYVSPELVGAVGGAGTQRPAAIITVAEAKDHLQIPAATTSYDGKLQGYLDAAAEVVEEIGDIVLSRSATETYDGGSSRIMLDRRPVLSVATVVEYSGVVAYPLTAAATPAQAGGPYHYSLESTTGMLIRRAAGVAIPFACGDRNIVVAYSAGQSTVPARVRLALKELIAHWWRWGQQAPRPAFGGVPDMTGAISAAGYAVPNRVVELLRPLPGVA